MLREVAISRLRILIPAALVVAEIACGSAPRVTSSEPITSPPIVTIPAGEGAPVLASPSSVVSTATPASRGSAPIVWRTDEQIARGEARRRNLPLLVYVRADWAAACLDMERSAWGDPRVIDAARGFVPLRLDVSEAEGNAELYAQRYGVTGVPEILILDAFGRTVATSTGGVSAPDLAALLREAAGD